jgi:hypothetical protein
MKTTESSPHQHVMIAVARYGGIMQHDGFELRGSYHYPSVAVLEDALLAARTRIEDDELGEIEPSWVNTFVKRGTKLCVQSQLPAAADRFLAAAVLETLASTAVEGVVEISRGGRCVDWFPSQPTD